MTLDKIALSHGTDKASSHHNYATIYEKYLNSSRFEPVRVLELGVGGYTYPDRGGNSLRMWEEYFKTGVIVGVDIHEKNGLDGGRVFIEKGSQVDETFLKIINKKHGPFDLIVDDASHEFELTTRSFEILFPMLRPTGIYIVEDVHTSFFSEGFGGDPDPNSSQFTTLKYFQRLTSQLYTKTLDKKFQGPFFGFIDFIHFYENLVIIRKK